MEIGYHVRMVFEGLELTVGDITNLSETFQR